MGADENHRPGERAVLHPRHRDEELPVEIAPAFGALCGGCHDGPSEEPFPAGWNHAGGKILHRRGDHGAGATTAAAARQGAPHEQMNLAAPARVDRPLTVRALWSVMNQEEDVMRCPPALLLPIALALVLARRAGRRDRRMGTGSEDEGAAGRFRRRRQGHAQRRHRDRSAARLEDLLAQSRHCRHRARVRFLRIAQPRQAGSLLPGARGRRRRLQRHQRLCRRRGAAVPRHSDRPEDAGGACPHRAVSACARRSASRTRSPRV